MTAILITQCLQNDFVKPLAAQAGPAPLPNLLHVGVEESRRLMGENPAEGPVAQLIRWANSIEAAQLKLVHIRDWHAAGDPEQAEHFRQFGAHCVADSDGAEFVFETKGGRPESIVNASGLNDFQGTSLAAELESYRSQNVRVGLAGVWTEAKISFLAYELRTRYPAWELAVCSALTAGSSRAAHFIALEQMQRLLGVRVFSSVGEFTCYLTSGAGASVPLPCSNDQPRIVSENTITGLPKISPADTKLLRYLFRDCSEIALRVLDGGFSGNMVAAVRSTDRYGHQQAPHVLKIGAQEAIGRERTAFERIEAVLGNNAPRIVDFADVEGRGALKYRYASMGGGSATSFQKMYMKGAPLEKVERILRIVFDEQLGRFYAAATKECSNLLDYYWFSPSLAPRVAELVKAVHGTDGTTIAFPGKRSVTNVARFYEGLATRPPQRKEVYFSFIHGDLNGANVIVDSQENVWLIDFFHTHRGHVLKDLLKMENDLFYIFTPVQNETDLDEALRITDALMKVTDLQAPLPDAAAVGLVSPQFVRAWQTLKVLRSIYPTVLREQRDVEQALIAQLRYAGHTLAFDEPNDWQRKWALYTACRCGEKLSGGA